MSRIAPHLRKDPTLASRLQEALSPGRLTASSLAALVLALAVPAAVGASSVPAAQPAELQTLEQRMGELTVSSQRFTGKVAVGGKLPRKLAALRGLSLSYAGEQSAEPPASRVTTTLLGKPLTLLQIGDTLYIEEPGLAKHDGGRPWVKTDSASSGKLFGSNPSLGSGTGLGSSAGGSATQAFKGLAELLGKATEVRSLGASTVDGQAVDGFAGTIAPEKLAEGTLPKKLLASLRRKHITLSARFETFIAPTGVPVRTSLTLGLGKVIRLKISSDVLAINFPVAPVPAPPATETISSAELHKLELAQAKKAKAKKSELAAR